MPLSLGAAAASTTIFTIPAPPAGPTRWAFVLDAAALAGDPGSPVYAWTSGDAADDDSLAAGGRAVCDPVSEWRASGRFAPLPSPLCGFVWEGGAAARRGLLTAPNLTMQHGDPAATYFPEGRALFLVWTQPASASSVFRTFLAGRDHNNYLDGPDFALTHHPETRRFTVVRQNAADGFGDRSVSGTVTPFASFPAEDVGPIVTALRIAPTLTLTDPVAIRLWDHAAGVTSQLDWSAGPIVYPADSGDTGPLFLGARDAVVFHEVRLTRGCPSDAEFAAACDALVRKWCPP